MQDCLAHDLHAKQRTKDVILEENVNFASLLLPSHIKKGLEAGGFRKPSPIQFRAIPLGRCGFDLIVKSKSGTGKTLVFSIIALETVNVTREHLQVLILVPTREIAVQICDVLKTTGRYIDGLVVEPFIGGMPLEDDVKKAELCHIAVGAPGRVKHLIKIGALSMKFVRLFVLDEADKLMEASFQADINEIYNLLPQRKQLIASSATYPKELDTFLANYMLSPTHVSAENETPLLLGLKHFVKVLSSSTLNAVQEMKAKNEILLEIFSKVSFTQCLVFTNYQTRTESVSNFLNQKGWNSSFISAAQGQPERLEAVKDLKSLKSRILLSTDVTSRGIDAANVDLVINYDMPVDAVTYLHRMGRAGRYGSSGMCINFALERDVQRLQVILGSIGSSNLSIAKLPVLDGKIDLWHVDPSCLEQIWGVVSDNSDDQISQNIKKEVLALKEREKNSSGSEGGKKNKKGGKKALEEVGEGKKGESLNAKDTCDLFLALKQGNNVTDDSGDKKGLKKTIKIEELGKFESARDLLRNKDKEVEDCLQSSTLLDSENLLSSLISGEKDNGIKRQRRSEALQNEKTSTDSQHVIFRKNRALLSITKLLYDSKIDVSSDLVESIGEHLTNVTETQFANAVTEESIEEILGYNDTVAASSQLETTSKDDQRDVLEDIFRLGYGYAVGRESKNWLDYFTPDEIDSFHKFCLEQINVSSESDDEPEEQEETEDYEMEEYTDEIVEEEAAENHDAALQWVPVVPNDSSNDASEYFASCYEDCSNVLWQQGLTFETVPDFDDWFYQWQEHLQSVRNYVQQNIYVEEMSRYQQSRLTNK